MERAEAGKPKGRQGRVAFAAAALLHVLLLLAAYLFWLQPPPSPGVVQSVAIRLTGLPADDQGSSAQGGQQVSRTSRLDDLQRRLEAPGSAPEVRPAEMSANELADLSEGAAADAPAARGDRAGGEDAGDPYGRVSFDKAAASSRAARDRIMLQASRCLARTGQGDPVRLEVRLRRDGRLARSAQIISPGGALSQARTDTELRAIQAVAQCAPYTLALGASTSLTYRIEVRGAAY